MSTPTVQMAIIDESKKLRRKTALGRRNQWLASFGVLAVFLLAWQFLPGLMNTPSYVLPPLSDVLAALFDPAALSISAPAYRFPMDQVETVAVALKKAVLVIKGEIEGMSAAR